MRVLVAGGAGFLGSHLCDRLIADFHEVVCVDSKITGSTSNVAHLLHNPRFRMIEGDVSIADDLPEIPFDWVLHFASPASPVAYGKSPIETLRAGSVGTLNLLDLAEENQAQFMLASTSEVYGDPKVHPQPETYWGNVNPVGWRSCYDEAKRFSEAATVAYRNSRGLEVRIPRIFNTYGPRMALNDGRPVVTFIRAALEGEPLPVQGHGMQTRSFCYVDDTVEALVRLMDTDFEDPINIGSTREYTILALADDIIEMVGKGGEIKFVPGVKDDPQVRRPDTTLAQSVLSWKPKVGIGYGLSQTIKWVEEQL